jgi:hypothetical protein
LEQSITSKYGILLNPLKEPMVPAVICTINFEYLIFRTEFRNKIPCFGYFALYQVTLNIISFFPHIQVLVLKISRFFCHQDC